MTIYSDVFGGALIYPSDATYRAVALTANLTLVWPTEDAGSVNVVADILDVSAASSFNITMPPANQASSGQSVLFNAVGASSFEVRRNDGVLICVVGAGQAWQIYLADNTTSAGVWRSFQYASFLSTASAGALAGNGLVAQGAQLARHFATTNINSNYVSGNSDRAKLFVWFGAGGSFTLADPLVLGNGWNVNLANRGTGAVTVIPGGTATIDGQTNKLYNPGESSIIITDGVNYFSVGFGRNAVFAFSNISIDVSSPIPFALTGSQLNRVSYNFIGVLTANQTVIVPDTVQQYWVTNSTTGSFTLQVKTAAGTGQFVQQGQATILYSDGTNVKLADTGGVSLPILVNQGGTGATTAAGARTNLGATSLGDALFIAVSSAAAYSALGVAPAGIVDGGTF